MVLFETSMLLFMFRIMLVLILVFRELDRYGLARVINKLIMYIVAAGRQFMLFSMAEVVRKLSSNI